jgi:hypothetical protein
VAWKAEDKTRAVEELITGFGVGRNIVLAICLIITVFALNGNDVFNKLINPEYYAAKDLVETIHEARNH